jgi:hypothetical protein
MKNLLIAVISIFIISSASAAADQNTIIYVGSGSQINDSKNLNKGTPGSIGFMHQLENSEVILGLDTAGEGTMLVSNTWVYNPEAMGLSFNGLIGSNLYDNSEWKIDGAVLVGFRELSDSCPRSFIGFRCYANRPALIKYETNYGGVVMLSYNSFSFGVRMTEVSQQALLGFRFGNLIGL